MEEKTLFPREEKSEILFKKISEDKWACEKLMETFCSYLFSKCIPDSLSVQCGRKTESDDHDR